MIKSSLFGLAIADALGVPVEFKSRNYLKSNPVTSMQEYGTYRQPKGTWSDDSSLTFCLAESIAEGFSLEGTAKRFENWYDYAYWTPHGEVFDIGIATRKAIMNLIRGVNPIEAGGIGERDNGNGSLMRILPLIFHSKDKDIDERYQLTQQVSSITHRHIRSVISCFYYLEFAREIMTGKNKFEAYDTTNKLVFDYLSKKGIDADEIQYLDRLFKGNIHQLPEEKISSSGYVIHSLEASIWCLLNTENYKDAVLKAVNLGEDTDTVGAITGGIAGIIYGYDAIPAEWIDDLVGKDKILDLAERMRKAIL